MQVHVLMYGYYFCSSIGINLSFIRSSITTIQLTQFLVIGDHDAHAHADAPPARLPACTTRHDTTRHDTTPALRHPPTHPGRARAHGRAPLGTDPTGERAPSQSVRQLWPTSRVFLFCFKNALDFGTEKPAGDLFSFGLSQNHWRLNVTSSFNGGNRRTHIQWF